MAQLLGKSLVMLISSFEQTNTFDAGEVRHDETIRARVSKRFDVEAETDFYVIL